MLPMQQNEKIFKNPLFFGFAQAEIESMLDILQAKTIKIAEKRVVIREGERNPYIFMVLSGEAYGIKYDIFGRETIYNHFSPGSVFGDVLAVSAVKESPVTVIASPGTELLQFRFDSLVSAKTEHLELRSKLLRNLTSELANKFFELQDRVDCLVAPSLREKIMMFLENQTKKQKSKKITLSLNRERLAAYLNTDRSALCRELSRMKKDGIIDFDKKEFVLLV